MKRKKLLYVLPICLCILLSPVSAVRAGAVTVDIKSNYDEGLIKEENDGSGLGDSEVYTPASEASSSASSASSASTPAANNAASTASSATNAAASTASSTAAATEASTTAATPAASTAAVSTTTDLPKTGDDNRIMITFTVMLTSLAIFLTALLAEKVGKKS